MQKGFGNQSSKNHKKAKRIVIIAVCALILLVTLQLAYWAVVDPIVSRYKPHTRIYEGLEYYTQGTYQDFDGSAKFDTFMQSFSFSETAQIVDFYHVDNKREDNPIYGKRSDLYSLEVQLSPEEYEEFKKQVSSDNFVCRYGSYTIYNLDVSAGERTQGAIAFHQTKYIIRCILVTDVTKEEPNYYLVYSMLRYHTNLDFEGRDVDWNLPGGQGDGSVVTGGQGE